MCLIWCFYYFRKLTQGASSWNIGFLEHVIPESQLNFSPDCFRTIMYFCEKLKTTPCTLNMMFNEIIYLVCISEHNNRDLLGKMSNLQDSKIWNQELFFPDQHFLTCKSLFLDKIDLKALLVTFILLIK